MSIGIPALVVLRDETSLCVRLAEGEEVEEEEEEEEEEGEEEQQLGVKAHRESYWRHAHIWTEGAMKTR